MVKFDGDKFAEMVGILLGQELSLACPKISTRMSKAFLSTMRIEGDTIVYTLPHYADYVINGSPPHDIVVKDKKTLAVPLKDWTGKKPNAYNSGKFPMLSKDGKFVLLGKRVKHPGNAPNPFIQDVLNRKFEDIVKQALEISRK